jgi:hypothetical protein
MMVEAQEGLLSTMFPEDPFPPREKPAWQGQRPVREDAVSWDSPSAVENDFANPEIILAYESRSAKAGPLH